MARNQRLNATITIGAALQGSVRRSLDVVGRGLQNVGDEIRSVTQRQRELDRQRRVLERQGQSVDALDREYQELTETLARLEARQQRLRRISDGMGNVGAAFSGMTDQIARTARTAGVAVGAVGAATVGLASSTANSAREIGLMAELANAGTEEFQRMAAAASTVGIEQDQMADILKDVNDRVGDFLQTGGGPMADFFENIGPLVGVTADHFRDLSGPEALQLYVSSLEQAGLSQQEMTFYLEAMASDATALIPLLRNNGAEMTRLGDAAASVGAILDDETIDAARRFSQQMAQSQQSLMGVRNIIGAELMPVVGQLAEEFTAFVVENRPLIAEFADTLGQRMRDAIPVIGEIVSGLGDVVRVIGNVVTAAADLLGGWDNLGVAVGVAFVSPAILAIGRLGFALVGLIAATGPIGLVIAGVAAAAGLIIANWDTIRDAGVAAWDALRDGAQAAVDWVVEKFQWLADRINALLAPIRDAFSFAGGVVDRVGNFFEPDEPSQGSRGVQRRAVGGTFLPGATLVGERGPELRFEDRAGFIATNRQLRGMADMADRIRGVAARGVEGIAQQMQQSLTIAEGAITINAAPGMDPRAIADAVLGELQRRQRGALYEGGAF